MEIGLALASNTLGDTEAMRDLGISWVKFDQGIGEDIGDASHGNIANLRPRLEQLVELGLRPIVDLRTSAEAINEWARELRVELIGNVPDEELGQAVYQTTYSQLAETVAQIVGDNAELCQDWEWWGEPDCPHVTQGIFDQFEYGLSLSAIYKAAKDANPDCRVWHGGFGVQMNMKFLEHVVKAYCEKCRLHCDPRYEACPNCEGPLAHGAGNDFDVCNLHHYVHGRSLDAMLTLYDARLGYTREILDGPACKGQWLASTEWGLPTVPTTKPPPWLKSHVLSQGVQAVCEPDAAEWYDAMFALFEAHRMQVVCVCTLDDIVPSSGGHWGDYCGLRSEYAFEGEALPESGVRRKKHWETIQEWAWRGRENPAFQT